MTRAFHDDEADLAVLHGRVITRVGAIETTFAEETKLDHFMEQNAGILAVLGAVRPNQVGLLPSSERPLVTKRGSL